MFLMMSPIARPMAALAMSPGLIAPEPLLTWISLRIGPLIIQHGAQDPVLTL